MTLDAAISPSVRLGLSLVPSTSLTSSWAGMPSTGSPAMRRVRTAAENHNYTDVPSSDGRGECFAAANHDVTTYDAITVQAENVAALAKQGAPPRGEPR